MAGHKYAVTHQTAGGSNLTIVEIVNPGTTRRAWIYDIVVGSDATPADAAAEFNMIRGTVSGAGTAVTGRPLDPGNPAAVMLPEGGTFTGQTKTANSDMLQIPLNQRATFRWVAAPDSELVIPATSDNWVGLECIAVSTGTPNINASVHWQE